MRIERAIKDRVKLATIPNAQRRICTYLGCQFFADNGNKIESRLISQDYDRATLGLVSMLVKPGHVCMDIGANIGVYSVVMQSLAGRSGEVHSFEPVNHIRRKAMLNLQLNGCRNVRLNDFALGASPGTLKMLQVKSGIFRAGTSSMLETDSIEAVGREHFDEVDVRVETLDNYVAELGMKQLDFIKMDVEGFEIFVLQGATKTLAKLRPAILFEYDLGRLDKLGISEEDFAKIFQGNNYVIIAPQQISNTYLVDEYVFDGKGAKRDMLALPL
jgi:FkbM family methyltransferase